MLNFDAGTKARIIATVTLDFDPVGTTIELKVGSTWYDAVWLGTPLDCNGEWIQDAQTVEYFAGPEVEVEDRGTAVLLSSNLRTKTRVASGEDIIVWDSTLIKIV